MQDGKADRLYRGMQDCFRLHPEMYGSELEDDEEMVEEELQARESAPVSGDVPTTTSEPSTQVSPEVASKTTEETTEKLKPTEESHHDSQTTTVEVAQNLGSERGEVLPKVVHETTK
jgi:intermembrane space import and assembly protein 40